MAIRSVSTKICPEKSTFQYQCDFLDKAGVILGAGDLTTLTLTLYNQDAAKTIINLVDAVNVKDTGRGAFDGTTKRFTLTLLPADAPMVDATKPLERHIALLKWTYNAGAEGGAHEIEIPVRNLYKVT